MLVYQASVARQWVVANSVLPTSGTKTACKGYQNTPPSDHKVTDLFLEALMKISVCQVLVARAI